MALACPSLLVEVSQSGPIGPYQPLAETTAEKRAFDRCVSARPSLLQASAAFASTCHVLRIPVNPYWDCDCVQDCQLLAARAGPVHRPPLAAPGHG